MKSFMITERITEGSVMFFITDLIINMRPLKYCWHNGSRELLPTGRQVLFVKVNGKRNLKVATT